VSEQNADPIAWLVAHEQIRQLASRYAVAMDARDIDALVSLFVEDVRVGRQQVGRDALRANFTEQLRDLGVTILLVGNHVISLVDEDHATGIVSCRGEIEMGDRWVVQAIQYHDTYERRGGTWLFVRRRHFPPGRPSTAISAEHGQRIRSRLAFGEAGRIADRAWIPPSTAGRLHVLGGRDRRRSGRTHAHGNAKRQTRTHVQAHLIVSAQR